MSIFRRLPFAAIVVVFTFPAISGTTRRAQTAPVSVRQSGWTVEYSPDDEALSISLDGLGELIGKIHLNEETSSGLRRLARPKAYVEAGAALVLETDRPKSAWRFDPRPGKLTITTTDFHGVLTGAAPVSIDRTIGRLMDEEGLPVDWKGVDEVVETYGGAATHNPSHLPRHNADVAYLALGQVAASGLHSLFDRKTDTAIDFGVATAIEADEKDGQSYALAMQVKDSATIAITPDYYTHVLGLPFYARYDDSRFPSAPMVWSSWTSYYEAVTERDIVRNTDWLASRLKPYGFEYVQLDDGYDRRPEGHSWIENWDSTRFPRGAEWLTAYIHGKGLKAGLWLVPNSFAAGVKEHPDWYLYDKQGKVLLDYDTPALDSTNPQVTEFLKTMFTTLDRQGFDYYKFDGEHALPAYAPPVDKSRLRAPSIDFIENYRRRLAAIRTTIGPGRFIEACPTGTPLNGIGFVDSYFNGQDLYNNWQGMYSLFSAINGNLFLNHMVSYVMPGEGLELGEPTTMSEAAAKRPAITLEMERKREEPATGFGTTLAEARTLVTYIALTGVAYPLASVMPELPEERVRLLQATMPTLPILPIDLFSRGTDSSWDKFKHVQADYYIHHYPEVLDLKVNTAAGRYDVASETNWRSDVADRALDFADQLGLPPGKYVVFDFWQQRPLGIFDGKLDVEIQPHDSRVLSIHPLLDRPQLIGLSRHISGSYSILGQAWDAAAKQLNGESVSVPGARYSLWFHLPADFDKPELRLTTKSGKPIAAEWSQHDGFAQLSFVGVEEPVKWQLQF